MTAPTTIVVIPIPHNTMAKTCISNHTPYLHLIYTAHHVHFWLHMFYVQV